MTLGVAAAFIVVACIFTLLALLLLWRVALLGVQHRSGRHGDGLKAGKAAPRWQRTDHWGMSQSVPSLSGAWQVLVFSDHSIREFPELAGALAEISNSAVDLDVLLISRIAGDVTARAARSVGLEAPIIVVDDRFYKTYNVWVMPHILLLDSEGIVLASGNVGSSTTLRSMLSFVTASREDIIRAASSLKGSQ